ncbi:hypothetical protein, partial [Bosea sp. OK403]|uniref:hypothetical protein n=1 Tax=Bosea sp. OK403 TaxID=1855286 RepID=UPI001AEC81E7
GTEPERGVCHRESNGFPPAPIITPIKHTGIHAGALAGEVPEWIPGLLAVARDDGAFRDEIPTD